MLKAGVFDTKIVNHHSSMQLVECETGNVLDIVIRAGDRIDVVRKERDEAKRTMEETTVLLNAERRFIKQFPDISTRLCERLSPNAVWLLNVLIPYVGINSGILRVRNGRFLKRVDILKRCECAMSERTADRAITELCQNGVLAKCTVENQRAFIMNPYVLQNGSRANRTLLTLFKDTEWANG